MDRMDDDPSYTRLRQGENPKNNVTDYLRRHRDHFPDRVALYWVARDTLRSWKGTGELNHASITYATLAHRVACTAKGLKEVGFKKGDRVIITLPPSLEMYVSMFAVLHIGGSPVFLEPWFNEKHVAVCVKTVKPVGVIFSDGTHVSWEEHVPLRIRTGQGEDREALQLRDVMEREQEMEVEAVAPETTALITFTTGSSGVPKGISRSHRLLVMQHNALDHWFPFDKGDIDLPVFPVFALHSLAAGVPAVLPALHGTAPSERNAALLATQLLSLKVTSCTLPPALFLCLTEYCSEHAVRLDHVRRIVIGGSWVKKGEVEKFKSVSSGAEVCILYGSTEVEPIACIRGDEMSTDESRKGMKVGSISEKLEHKFVRIRQGAIELDPSGWKRWEVEKGEMGELILRGPHVSEDTDAETESAKATKITGPDGRVWHRTGDVGWMDEEEKLWIVGRIHNVIFRGEECLFPTPVEMLLKELDFVQAAAFLGMGGRACAVISLKKGWAPERWGQYIEATARQLGENRIPYDEIRIVKEIPLDPRHHSKVDYSKLSAELERCHDRDTEC